MFDVKKLVVVVVVALGVLFTVMALLGSYQERESRPVQPIGPVVDLTVPRVPVPAGGVCGSLHPQPACFLA